jgi:hypothetical protein
VSSWFETLATSGPRVIGRPLLAVSDIRGDLLALEALLDAVANVQLCGIVAAGDHCLGGPQPFEVWQRLNALGATLVRGVTDLALGSVATAQITPRDAEQEAYIEEFLRTRRDLGELICRRLLDLPSTHVVSLDDRSGVMLLHGSPRDEQATLDGELDDDELEDATSCVAEDVLVVGRAGAGYVRRLHKLLVVHAGSVARNEARGPGGCRTAHGVLIAPFSDGVVRAVSRDVAVADRGEEGGGRRLRRSAS